MDPVARPDSRCLDRAHRRPSSSASRRRKAARGELKSWYNRSKKSLLIIAQGCEDEVAGDAYRVELVDLVTERGHPVTSGLC